MDNAIAAPDWFTRFPNKLTQHNQKFRPYSRGAREGLGTRPKVGMLGCAESACLENW